MDSPHKNQCIRCSNGGTLLSCSSCSIAVHDTCMGCDPHFDDNCNFLCPYCFYRETTAKERKLKEKAILAKKQLSIFNGETEKEETCFEDQNDPDSDDVQNKCCKGKGTEDTLITEQIDVSVSPNKCGENPEEKIEVDGVESDRVILLASRKARRVIWSEEEVGMLKKGVEECWLTAKKNIPWKKILEFGHSVFDSSRTPSDLKDKWRNINK